MKELDLCEVNDLIKYFKLKTFCKKDIILEKGVQKSETLIYLLHGNLVNETNNEILLKEHTFHGVKDCFEEDVINEYIQDDHISDRDGILLEIEKRLFLKILNQKSLHSFHSKVRRERKLTGTSYCDTRELYKNDVDVENLQILTTLGSGQFGNVFLAYDEICDEMYAVKSINKSEADEE